MECNIVLSVFFIIEQLLVHAASKCQASIFDLLSEYVGFYIAICDFPFCLFLNSANDASLPVVSISVHLHSVTLSEKPLD